MDAFFAAIEVRDNPALKGKPVIIARDPRQSGGRGVVSTCSYEARAFGVHSAMSSKEAYERCPQGIFISGNYEKYQEVGRQVREIFHRYTDLVEPMSIDEAYLDVTENKLGISSAVKIAKLIQYDIWNELHLTASAGVSYNKFLAKIASDMEKPRGLTVILPQDAQEILSKLPIEKFYGVGKKSVPRLHDMGIYTGADLLEIPEMTLIDHFGRFGYDLYRRATLSKFYNDTLRFLSCKGICQLSTININIPFTESFQFSQLVTRDKHRDLAFTGPFFENINELLNPDWIQTNEWFVENKEVRFGNHGDCQCCSLFHPEGKSFWFTISSIPEFDNFQGIFNIGVQLLFAM